MNYTQPVIYDFPYDNPVTKVACGIGVLWLGYLAIRYSKKDEEITPVRRLNRKGFMNNILDKAIDEKNRALGGPVPNNPDIPFNSRENYNRARRRR